MEPEKRGMKTEKKANKGQGNGGFSLVELLVVMAIMAVLATAAVTGIGMLTGFRMNECVKKLDAGLGETRIDTMSRGSGSLRISCDTDGSYYMKRGDGPKERIAGDAITISYICNDDGAYVEYPLLKGGSIEITYEPGSGKFCPLKEESAVSESRERSCEKLIVRMGERHEAVIVLVPETGRHYIE